MRDICSDGEKNGKWSGVEGGGGERVVSRGGVSVLGGWGHEGEGD